MIPHTEKIEMENTLDKVSDFHSKAKFVLLVEKEASFQKLNDDNILTKLGPCIMITVWFLFIFCMFNLNLLDCYIPFKSFYHFKVSFNLHRNLKI